MEKIVVYITFSRHCRFDTYGSCFVMQFVLIGTLQAGTSTHIRTQYSV